MVKKLKWNLIFMSLLYVGLGIFLVMKPGTALNIVCYALGGVVLACAAVQLIRYFVVERGVFQSQLTLISGLICLALGVFLLLRSDIVVSILPIVFGLFVIFDAIGRVQNALDLRRCGYDSWKGFLLLPVLSVVLGVVLILNPFGAMETLVMAIGIILIVEGAINLLSALYTVLAVRRFAKLHPETQSVLESITGEDLNGDGVIDDYDRTIIGCGQPLNTGGFGNNFNWKNFDLNIFFAWSYGNDVLNANRLVFESGWRSQTNQLASYADRWSPENQTSRNFRTNGQGPSGVYSSRTIEDGSFLRLKTLQLSYKLPRNWIRKLHIASCEIFVSGQNLFTWTDYSGLDPEVSTRYTALTPGFDYSAYARNRIFTGGIKLIF